MTNLLFRPHSEFCAALPPQRSQWCPINYHILVFVKNALWALSARREELKVCIIWHANSHIYICFSISSTVYQANISVAIGSECVFSYNIPICRTTHIPNSCAMCMLRKCLLIFDIYLSKFENKQKGIEIEKSIAQVDWLELIIFASK